MSLIKNPMTGMKDILPSEMQIRDYIIGIIKDTYNLFGFVSIETPAVEHIENLLSKQGGDNEKLIFKILKRGEKLNLEQANKETDLVDGGLRYDLTLPLARYYANNEAKLNTPFKTLQIGSVWRAERPQKGRFRQFTQCDIDILGDDSYLSEIELITATSMALEKICPDNKFQVRINDRQILKAMALYAEFDENLLDRIFIILDKLDKISFEGVKKELLELGIAQENIDKYISLFDNLDSSNLALEELKLILKDYIDENIIDNLINIINISNSNLENRVDIIFDPSLVRGMDYYTGTIFEISMEGFLGSVAGGGRYDKMIGKFIGKDVPACGFSIGFERIIGILMDNNFKFQINKSKVAYLFEKNLSKEKMQEMMKLVMKQRQVGNIVLVTKMNKNKKFQKNQLLELDYKEIIEVYNDSNI